MSRFHSVSAHSKRCLNDHSIEDIHLDQTMKIIQLQIYLLMWSQVTESLTNTAVTLGADVIISCDLDIEEIYWYKQKSPDPPEFILRTYSSTYEGAEYENSIFTHKYSVKTNSRLFIRNITADELGVYYCVKTSEPRKFSNGIRIYITDSVHRNQTESQQETPWRNLTIITSVLLNVLLIIALIGLVKCCLDATRRSKNTSEKPQSTTAAQNTNDPQYADIDFSKCSRRNRPRPRPDQDQTTYSLLQPVKTV
uniref:Ig-like domain-containing protein n=1 Tax=Cyprinus carpio carpio TaxID=630221 RepID=A0A9J8C5Q7_CYPCA